ncbi:MAG: hypothetical protein ACK5K8_05725 [Pseudanabaena sp.]
MVQDLSYLKIGWNWIHTALTKNWTFFPSEPFTSYLDSEPAMASHRKHRQKFFRIEFYASILDYSSYTFVSQSGHVMSHFL